MHNKKVDFLIAGAQKSGTTALDSYLRTHENICMGDFKELHYFDDESQFEQEPDYNEYHKSFSPKDCHEVIGEATPIYMYWDSSMKRIWEYNPKIKIILLLRNPIARAYSHWNMEIKRGAEELPFSEAIREEHRRIKEALPLQHRVYSYVDRGYYSEQIRRIYRFFPREQVLILKHDELYSDINSVLMKISNFLGIKNFQKHSFRSVHTLEYKEPMSDEDFDYLKNIFFYEIKQLERTLGWDCSSWLRRD